jgi:hypothetical protein
MSGRTFSSGATQLIALIAMTLPILGIIGILVYTGFSSIFGVGLLAALGAAAVGLLIGLLFGVPKAVSSGQVRQSAQIKQVADQTVVSALPAEDQAALQQWKAASDAQQTGQTKTSNFAPSTNLAEVSDWLTKLLIGASLVSLSKLGPPIGHLIDSIAGGLSTGGSVTGSAKVVAGAILFGYVAMGFLDGYILTTVWYQRELDEG